MTLDLGALSPQIRALSDHLSGQIVSQSALADRAADVLRDHAARWEDLSAEAEYRSQAPPAARPSRPLDAIVAAPRLPESYAVVATDGSQIEADRHAPVYCHLINIGRVFLEYGEHPVAQLDCQPVLAYRDEDLYLRIGPRRVPVEGHLLAMKRHVLELRAIVDLVDRPRAPESIVALRDGTLTLPAIEGRGVEAHLRPDLVAQFLESLDELQKRRVPIAGYVSLPRASEVVNLLRIAECPLSAAECNRQCEHAPVEPTYACHELAGLPDRLVFARLLEQRGMRTPCFLSPWRTSLERYGAHRVHFFYVHVGAEVARVEVPEWVATDPDLVGRVHAVILAQVDRGQGYPRALIEAHEQAVVRAIDRQVFWELVDRQLVGSRIDRRQSEKQWSKRLRSL